MTTNDLMKTRFTRRWIIFDDEKAKSSTRNEFTSNVVNFGVNNSNSKHSENKIIDFMFLGRKLNEIVGILDKSKMSFHKKLTFTLKVCLIPRYNHDNSYFLWTINDY